MRVNECLWPKFGRCKAYVRLKQLHTAYLVESNPNARGRQDECPDPGPRAFCPCVQRVSVIDTVGNSPFIV